MIDEDLKQEIQTAYSRLLEAKGFRARHCQKTMIAEIARALGSDSEEDNKICVIEAGTGTGKTIAYAIAAIPIAKRFKKKIVIATATVALQEQIVLQDLPDIRMHSDLDFSFTLAKGRRRYLCLSRLDQALQDSGSMNQTLAMFEEPAEAGDPVAQGRLYERMLGDLGRGEWDGERDSWPEEIEHASWSRISTDHAQCTQRRCSHYQNCYFYRARENVHRVDCIVANQDLVLSDLMMGGGAVLPEPEETIYIFDEGHHLPDKAGNHFSHFLVLNSTRNWLQQIPTSASLASAAVPSINDSVISRLGERCNEVNQHLDVMGRLLMGFREQAEVQDGGWRHRFAMGRVPQEVTVASAEMLRSTVKLLDVVNQQVPKIEDQLEVDNNDELEHWLSVFSSIVARLESAVGLWSNFAVEETQPPSARWLKFLTEGQIEGVEIQISSHPVSVSEELKERLWSRCAGAVITSATLSVARDFSSLQSRTGIDDSNVFVSLQSPFDFQNRGRLLVPRMKSNPSEPDDHTDELAEIIPGLVENEPGALVLFTSWRQMFRVHDNIDPVFRERVLMQGELSKMEIIVRHKSNVDGKTPSCIFGLASFAEGVDLPGDYCTHVVIAKIPFSVPDDPVDATLSEWIEENGGNSFYELMLPNAAIRVVQSAGRLLRTETDSGTVSILDRRVVDKRYGRVILDSLPPFRREIQ